MSEIYAHNPRTLLRIAPYLRSRSVAPVEIFKRAEVSPSTLVDANGWVPRDLCFKLSNEMHDVTGDQFFGAKVGRTCALSDFGTWGAAVSGAPTLRQACTTAAMGIGLLHQGTDLKVRTEGKSAFLSFAFLGRSRFEPRQHVLAALAALRNVALLAGVPDAVGVRFSQAYERAGEQLEEIFGPSLNFGCDEDAIVIDRAIFDLTIPEPPAPVRHADPLETAKALTSLLRESLPYGHVNVVDIAARLKVSTRTLQRRLRDWGFSFEEMIDDIRHTEAIRRLGSGEESMMEIAIMLGYSDQAHFTRAFRRWTGMPPREYARRFLGRSC